MSEYKYQSPIEMIQGEMVMRVEDGIVKAVQDVGINVDKGELLKALVYDRDQYNKGYNDGKPKVGKWLDGERAGYNGIYYYRYCSECLFERNDDDVDKDTPYCPNCGARMKGE